MVGSIDVALGCLLVGLGLLGFNFRPLSDGYHGVVNTEDRMFCLQDVLVLFYGLLASLFFQMPHGADTAKPLLQNTPRQPSS